MKKKTKPVENTLKNSEEAEALIEKLKRLKELIAATEKAIDEGEETLRAYMDFLHLRAFETQTTYASISEGKSVWIDSARMKAERPKLYEEYKKSTSYTRLHYGTKS